MLTIVCFIVILKTETTRHDKKRGKSSMTKPVNKQTLYQMRKESGLSTTEIAHAVGSSYPALLNWEKGKSIPSAVSMRRLLDLYGKKHEDLDWSIFEENVKQELDDDEPKD